MAIRKQVIKNIERKTVPVVLRRWVRFSRDRKGQLRDCADLDTVLTRRSVEKIHGKLVECDFHPAPDALGLEYWARLFSLARTRGKTPGDVDYVPVKGPRGGRMYAADIDCYKPLLESRTG